MSMLGRTRTMVGRMTNDDGGKGSCRSGLNRTFNNQKKCQFYYSKLTIGLQASKLYCFTLRGRKCCFTG